MRWSYSVQRRCRFFETQCSYEWYVTCDILQSKCIWCYLLVAAAASNCLPAWAQFLRYDFAEARGRLRNMESLGRSYVCGNFMHLIVSDIERFGQIQEMFAFVCMRLRFKMETIPVPKNVLYELSFLQFVQSECRLVVNPVQVWGRLFSSDLLNLHRKFNKRPLYKPVDSPKQLLSTFPPVPLSDFCV